MTVRGFYNTVNRDQIPITFDYPEEKRAFEKGLDKISGIASKCHNILASLTTSGRPTAGKEWDIGSGFTARVDKSGRIIAIRESHDPLFTTLEQEQVGKHADIVMAIYGLNVCNIHSRNNMTMCLYTDYKWKEDKWVPRA